MYILIEIQNLWGSLQENGIRQCSLPSLSSTSTSLSSSSSLSLLSKNSNIDLVRGLFAKGIDIFIVHIIIIIIITKGERLIDDDNTSFSPVFLRQIFPFLSEAAKLMNSKPKSYSIDSTKRQTPTAIASSFPFSANNSTVPQSPVSTKSIISTSSAFATIANRAESTSLISSNKKLPSTSRSNSNGSNNRFSISSPIQSALSPRTLSFGASSPTSPIQDNHHFNNLSRRLEVAFWQQHPQLFKICASILEHVEVSCFGHLREKVAVAIRELWSRSALLRAEYDDLLKKLSSNTSLYIVTTFQEKLTDEVDRMHSQTVEDGRLFLDDFIPTHLSTALNDICKMYPCHERVHKLACDLVKNQIKAQHAPLLSSITTYSRRKLEEVCTISVQQLQKAIDGQLLADEKKSSSLLSSSSRSLSSSPPTSPSPTPTSSSNVTLCISNLKIQIKNIVNYFDVKALSTDHDNNGTIKDDDSTDDTVNLFLNSKSIIVMKSSFSDLPFLHDQVIGFRNSISGTYDTLYDLLVATCRCTSSCTNLSSPSLSSSSQTVVLSDKNLLHVIENTISLMKCLLTWTKGVMRTIPDDDFFSDLVGNDNVNSNYNN